MDMMDGRYGRPDSERSRARVSAFTDFKRGAHGNYKDFWARFARFAAKLEALGMPMNKKVVFNRSIRALRLPEGQLPIALSALGTRPGRFIAPALRERSPSECMRLANQAEIQRRYASNAPETADSHSTYHAVDNDWGGYDWAGYDEEWDMYREDEVTEVTLEGGSTMLTKPRKPSKPRNTPGIREASRRGEVKNFTHIPNRKGKGGGSQCVSSMWRFFKSLARMSASLSIKS